MPPKIPWYAYVLLVIVCGLFALAVRVSLMIPDPNTTSAGLVSTATPEIVAVTVSVDKGVVKTCTEVPNAFPLFSIDVVLGTNTNQTVTAFSTEEMKSGDRAEVVTFVGTNFWSNQYHRQARKIPLKPIL